MKGGTVTVLQNNFLALSLLGEALCDELSSKFGSDLVDLRAPRHHGRSLEDPEGVPSFSLAATCSGHRGEI